MTALSLEMHAGHVQSAVAHIANGNRAIRATACVHTTKSRRAANRELTGRGIAGDINAKRAGRIIAAYRDRRSLRAEADRLKTDGNRQRITRSNRDRIRQYFRHSELAGGGS